MPDTRKIRPNIDALEIAALRATADKPYTWNQVGNTFYYGPRPGVFVAIPGGTDLVAHIVANQPEAVLRLLECYGEMRAMVNALRTEGNALAAHLADGAGEKADVLRDWDKTNAQAWELLESDRK